MSPPKAVPKVIINVKVAPAGVEWLDELAKQFPTATRSDAVRHALNIAKKHEAEVRTRMKEFHS